MIPTLQKGQVGRTILGSGASGDAFADLISENEGTGDVGSVSASMVNPITGVYGTGYAGLFGFGQAAIGVGGAGVAGTPTPALAVLLGGTGVAGYIGSVGGNLAALLAGVSGTGALGSFGMAQALTTVAGTGGVGTVAMGESFSLWRFEGMDWQPTPPGNTSDYIYDTPEAALAVAQYNYEVTWGEPHPGYSRGAYIRVDPATVFSPLGAPLRYGYRAEVGGYPPGTVNRYVL